MNSISCLSLIKLFSFTSHFVHYLCVSNFFFKKRQEITKQNKQKILYIIFEFVLESKNKITRDQVWFCVVQGCRQNTRSRRLLSQASLALCYSQHSSSLICNIRCDKSVLYLFHLHFLCGIKQHLRVFQWSTSELPLLLQHWRENLVDGRNWRGSINKIWVFTVPYNSLSPFKMHTTYAESLYFLTDFILSQLHLTWQVQLGIGLCTSNSSHRVLSSVKNSETGLSPCLIECIYLLMKILAYYMDAQNVKMNSTL